MPRAVKLWALAAVSGLGAGAVMYVWLADHHDKWTRGRQLLLCGGCAIAAAFLAGLVARWPWRRAAACALLAAALAWPGMFLALAVRFIVTHAYR